MSYGNQSVCKRSRQRSKRTRNTAYNLARQRQDVDRVIVGGSGEGNGGPLRKIVHDAAKLRAAEEG